jgi:hypothetical protein
MAEMRPLTCTQLTTRLSTKISQLTIFHGELLAYVDNQKKLTDTQKISLDTIASLMLDTLRVIAKIEVHEKEQKTIPSIYSVGGSNFLRSNTVSNAILLSSNPERPMYFVAKNGKGKKLKQSKRSRPSPAKTGKTTESDSSSDSGSSSDEEPVAVKEQEIKIVDTKKRKADDISKSVSSDKEPRLDSHEAGRKVKKSQKADNTESATSQVIKYKDVDWEKELAAILEKSKADGLVNKLIDFFTTEDGVFHALDLLNETNFDFFECVAQDFVLECNEHVDTAIKLFIDGLLDSSPSVTVEDKDDLDQLWTWFNTTGTRYHAYVCSMKTTPDQKLAEMLAFIDKVADPQMANLKIQPNECYYSTPEGFFKTAAAIYRRFEQEGNPGMVIHPENVFPKVHMIFSNIKDSLKNFYTEHPEYACPGEEYEIIKYNVKKFYFMNVQEDFLPEISGELERRMMMCFHGMTSAYIKWCVQKKLPYCGVSTYETHGAFARCGNSCAFCSRFLQIIEFSDDHLEWGYATPEAWNDKDSVPDCFWTKVY